MSMDFRGDPSAALLRFWNPEQKAPSVFIILETPVDLSMFCLLRLLMWPIIFAPSFRQDGALSDLQLYGRGKVAYAERYLLPRQIKENGLHKGKISFGMNSIKHVIRHYNREKQGQKLERELAGFVVRPPKSLPGGPRKKCMVTP